MYILSNKELMNFKKSWLKKVLEIFSIARSEIWTIFF